MSQKRSKPGDFSDHPIGWFSALLRGIDKGDRLLVDTALAELNRLGFDIRLLPPRKKQTSFQEPNP